MEGELLGRKQLGGLFVGRPLVDLNDAMAPLFVGSDYVIVVDVR